MNAMEIIAIIVFSIKTGGGGSEGTQNTACRFFMKNAESILFLAMVYVGMEAAKSD